MTTAGWAWLAVAAVLAVLDWAAVAAGSQLLERCFKPAVLLALLAVALTAQPSHPGVHGWLVLALCLGLAGDVALAFAPDESEPGRPLVESPRTDAGEPAGTALPAIDAGPSALFTAGLASFLLGHLCYCAAMLHYGVNQLSMGLGLVLMVLVLLAFGRRILAGARAQGGTALSVAVAAYITALGSTVVLGAGTSSPWVACGVVLFAFSDLVLAGDRFVTARSWAPLTVAISYHLAQSLLVLGLVR